jgi:hypothetical protein
MKTGRMLGYAAPIPLREAKDIGKLAGEVRIRMGPLYAQIAPQVIPEGVDMHATLQPIADALNELYGSLGLPYQALVVVQPYPLKPVGGTRRRNRKRKQTRR